MISPDPPSQAGAPTGLARLVAADRDDFAQETWGRRPLLTTAAELAGTATGPATSGSPFADLLSTEAVDELLSLRGLRTPFLRVAKDGVTLPERDFTRPGGVGASAGDQVSDDDLLRLFADGHTLVLQGLHRTWAPILALAQDLAADLGHPVQANAYVTPAQSTGFSAHYDVHDVFVLQISGEKRWRLHAPVHELPLRTQPWDTHRGAVARAAQADPVLEATLRPGDCLYLPRGWLHSATALGGVSTHLTVGVHTWHRGHLADAVLAEAVARLAEDPAQRSSLPLGVAVGDATSYAADLEAVRAGLLAALAEVDAAAVAERLQSQHTASQRAAPIAPVGTVESLTTLDDGSRVSLREHLAARLVEGDHGGVLHGRMGRVTVSRRDLDHVRQLLASGSAAVADIGPDLARRLVVAGVATLDPAQRPGS